MRIGIDVGGTNTDAVLMDGRELLAQAKRPTTGDVTSGIVAALEDVLPKGSSKERIDAVMIGTTHFTNALLEHKDLAQTAVIRLALPATATLPPFVDWPEGLRDAIGGHAYMVKGGNEFDGREISELDVDEVRTAVHDMVRKDVRAVAVCGVFSPVNLTHEEETAAIIRAEASDIQVTLSSEIGRIGILERENAAALNACLCNVAERTVGGIREALNVLGLNVALFLSQNDGTLMDAGFAARFPVFTIASGPTNSMRGATILSGVRDGIVVDVGGTSTDVGALVKGFPRESSVAVSIAGVRTNFRMPDVLSIGLGGGSIVKQDSLSIGPESVGYRLLDKALVFGGKELTATDVAVAGELAQLGDSKLVKTLPAAFVERALGEMRRRVEEVVDQVKLSAEPLPVILVGGGSILIGDTLNGATQVLRPEHFSVANAIGAAIAQVGGQVEKVYSLDAMSREEARALAQQEAISKAVEAGADPATVELVELDEIPLTYLPSNATRIRAKAAGDLVSV